MRIKYLQLALVLLIANGANGIREYNVTNDLAEMFNATSDADGGKLFYRIPKKAHFKLNVTRHFNHAELFHSFECTFRIPQSTDAHLYESFGLMTLITPEMSFMLDIVVQPKWKRIKIYITLHGQSEYYVFYFDSINLLDGQWHNLMYGMHSLRHNQADIECWIDCIKESYDHVRQPYYPTTFVHHHRFSNLSLLIGDGRKGETVAIDISKMAFHRFSHKPLLSKCDNVKTIQYEGTTKNVKDEENSRETNFPFQGSYNKEYIYDDSKEANNSDYQNESASEEAVEAAETHHSHPALGVLGFVVFFSLLGISMYLLLKYY